MVSCNLKQLRRLQESIDVHKNTTRFKENVPTLIEKSASFQSNYVSIKKFADCFDIDANF